MNMPKFISSSNMHCQGTHEEKMNNHMNMNNYIAQQNKFI